MSDSYDPNPMRNGRGMEKITRKRVPAVQHKIMQIPGLTTCPLDNVGILETFIYACSLLRGSRDLGAN